MKFELKTENENFKKSFLNLFGAFFILSVTFIFCNMALKLAIISRHYQIDYNCRLLSVKKSNTYFKKLSSLSNLKSKQRIMEFCRVGVK